ncbi:hypothetical protein vseg_021530 [Gypsophila vaccaria]
MDLNEWRKTTGGGQIPAFGNWDRVDDMPITQYFECARQAGLVRYSSSSGECGYGDHHHSCNYNYNYDYDYDYNNNNVVCSVKPTRAVTTRSNKVKNREKRGGVTHVREVSRKQAGKVYDVRVTEKQTKQYQYDAALGGQAQAQPCRPPKAVDEDLYHIPPELLKRKRRLGFFSRCLVPPCAV